SLLILALSSCQPESRGFVLPKGDVQKGKQLFQDLKCHSCHSISDIAWAGSKEAGDVNLKLGGETTKLKMYGELVTSVINPNHKISQKTFSEQPLTTPEGTSRMPSNRYNDILTVQQLIDLVAFLQSEYKLQMPEQTYPYY
ncbi:MAG TPA: c-type cytochrome, partial [Saprospiraceae bacterium]|nr:c-type cytochrome [Saprospiraceae bacterium]